MNSVGFIAIEVIIIVFVIIHLLNGSISMSFATLLILLPAVIYCSVECYYNYFYGSKKTAFFRLLAIIPMIIEIVKNL